MKNLGKLFLFIYLFSFIFIASSMYVKASEVNKELTLKNLAPGVLNELKENIDTNLEDDVSYNKFLKLIEEGKIEKVFLEFKDFIYFIMDEKLYETSNPNSDSLKENLLLKDIEILTTKDFIEIYNIEKVENTDGDSNWIYWLIFPALFIMPFAFRAYFFSMISQEEEKAIAGQKAKDRAEQKEMMANARTFDDVAGLKEVKEDVKTLVDFIVNGDKYIEMGAKLPRGTIFYGPPGTGKTLLARAIAGEAGVPFYSASGSDFVEQYVGMGAKRIRELFKKAKENAPCIIFIDEIDAIGGKRGLDNGDSGEDRKTLNALLCEMDGFTNTNGVLVIGATNRIEDLDDALLRPGRFTNKYCVPLPESFEDRMIIIELYAKNKKFYEDVNLKELAKMTIGCSPAEIESILNEAAIIATREGLDCINADCIEESFNKHIFKGHVRKDTFNRRKKELKLVAWHEAGHALAGILLGENVNKVTILSSTTGAGGATFTIPKKMGLHSTEDLKKQIIGLYAGRCAEYLFLGDKEKITTGASNDIERATEIIYNMVAALGMNDNYGMLNLHKLHMGNDLILKEASKISKEMEEVCIEMLSKHRDELEKIVELLLENETIYKKDMEFIISREEIVNFIKKSK